MTIAKRAIPAFLAVGVGLNVLGGLLIDVLKLPIYLDTAGTMLVAVVAGPWWAALTGLLSNAVLSLWIPGDFWFGLANAAIGIVVGYIVRARGFKDYLTPLLAGLAAGFVGIVAGSSVASFVFAGATGGVTEIAQEALPGIARRLFAEESFPRLFVEIADKLISIYIVFYITRALPTLAPDPPEGFVDPVKEAGS